VRLIRPLLTVKVYRRIARIVRRSRGLGIFSPKTLHARPGFQQRSIHGEVLIRQQTPLPCLPGHSLEEGFANIPIEQALAVLGEHGHIPDRVIHIQAHKP
jgi:hypothetical protein